MSNKITEEQLKQLISQFGDLSPVDLYTAMGFSFGDSEEDKKKNLDEILEEINKTEGLQAKILLIVFSIGYHLAAERYY